MKTQIEIEGMVKTINRQAKAIKMLASLAVSLEKDRDGWKEETIHWRTGAKEADYRRENIKLRDDVDGLEQYVDMLKDTLNMAQKEMKSDVALLPTITQGEVEKVLTRIREVLG